MLKDWLLGEGETVLTAFSVGYDDLQIRGTRCFAVEECLAWMLGLSASPSRGCERLSTKRESGCAPYR